MQKRGKIKIVVLNLIMCEPNFVLEKLRFKEKLRNPTKFYKNIEYIYKYISSLVIISMDTITYYQCSTILTAKRIVFSNALNVLYTEF